MKHTAFVHLHVHSDYSFLDGAARVKPLVAKAAEFKMPALALTDHGNMCGAIKFYKECYDAGIKPIIGTECYIAPSSRFDRDPKYKKAYHITLLAMDYKGYVNLMKLNEISYSEGFYYKPRIDMETLVDHSNGLIALSGCLQGKVARMVLDESFDRALKTAGEFEDIFGKGNFYLELMDSGIPEQKTVNKNLYEISKRSGIGCVATNDCHYIERSDAYAQEIIMCIGTGKTIDDPTHMRFSADEYYLKSPDEMSALFADFPGAVSNTVAVSEKCNLQLEFGNIFLPEYEVPEGFTKLSYLEKLCRDNLPNRYSGNSDEADARLSSELEIINNLGFPGYFLICWDFVNHAKANSIPVGPGRGSGAGSIVSYLLGITDLDPLKYGLLFERFLNPARKSMPDLDIDFADTGRDKIIDYVKDKYGKDRVGQIGTFSTLKARAAIKDVGRVLNIPIATVNSITKMIPSDPNITIFKALEESKDLTKAYNSDERISQMIDIARKLEGTIRQPGVHAAGVVIAKDVLSNFVPRGISSDKPGVTQFEGEDLVELGLLKMDFLGLRTLSIIDKALEWIRNQGKGDIDINAIPMDDKKTFELLDRAESLGVFQLESSGFQELLRKMDVNAFEDIIALVALYRPGVTKSGMTQEFITRKKDSSKIQYPHPRLENILKETYGVILYQEQVMQVARTLGGFSPAQADDMRKAMSKKIPHVLERLRTDFVNGAEKNKIKRKDAEKIFDTLAEFAGYGFNKSHSAAYGKITYQTAYLKANYPTEYMCALLSCEMGNTDKVALYVQECERMGIKVEAPSVNYSFSDFTIEKENVIRYGLQAIKNVGGGAIDSIVIARADGKEFKSFYDFCARVNLKKINKRVIESLIKAGAFDYLGYGRRPLIMSIDSALSHAAAQQKDNLVGQRSFFDAFYGDDSHEIELEDKKKWHDNEKLKFEKEVMGFYFSGHPLTKYSDEINNLTNGSISSIIENCVPGSNVIIGGLVKHPRPIKTKQGKHMLAFRLEDLSDIIDAVVFPDSYNDEIAALVKEDAMIVAGGKLDDRKGNLQVIVERVFSLDDAKNNLVSKFRIKIEDNMGQAEIDDIKRIIDKYPGSIPVEFEIKSEKYDIIKITTETRTRISDALIHELDSKLGKGSVVLLGNK